MTPRATRVLTATLLGTLTLAASAWACDANKSAKATACAPASKAAVTASRTTPARGTAAVKKATPSSRKSVPVAAKKANPAEAGMRAYLDPETGRITSLPQVTAMAADGLPGGAPVILVEQPLPGRGYTIDLQGTLEDYTVLTIDSKGRRHLSCSKDPRTALKQVPAPSSPAFPEE